MPAQCSEKADDPAACSMGAVSGAGKDAGGPTQSRLTIFVVDHNVDALLEWT